MVNDQSMNYQLEHRSRSGLFPSDFRPVSASKPEWSWPGSLPAGDDSGTWAGGSGWRLPDAVTGEPHTALTAIQQRQCWPGRVIGLGRRSRAARGSRGAAAAGWRRVPGLGRRAGRGAGAGDGASARAEPDRARLEARKIREDAVRDQAELRAAFEAQIAAAAQDSTISAGCGMPRARLLMRVVARSRLAMGRCSGCHRGSGRAGGPAGYVDRYPPREAATVAP